GHLRMDGTEIRIGTRLRKFECELVVGIQRLRLDGGLVVADYGVRNVILIRPRHLGANGNSDGLRAEAEVVDLDGDRRVVGSHRTLRGKHGDRDKSCGYECETIIA